MRQPFSPLSVSPFATIVVVGMAIATSGCAYTMGGFDRPTASATPASIDGSATGALPIKPATYVVDTTDAPAVPRGAAAAPATGATAGAYPNINQVPQEPKSNLLSPEEKAKVIADLEALARSQEAAVEKSRRQAAAKCDQTVQKSLNPEAKLKGEAAGQGC